MFLVACHVCKEHRNSGESKQQPDCEAGAESCKTRAAAVALGQVACQNAQHDDGRRWMDLRYPSLLGASVGQAGSVIPCAG